MDDPPVIGFAGGGFYISWILGVAAGMQRIGTPIDRCVLSGASAGAAVAAVLACGVDMHRARDWFFTDPASLACFSSPVGAALRVHDVMRTFMETMLPEDAAARSAGRLHIVVCSRKRGCYFSTDFRSKADIIDAVAASSHMPYFSNGRYAFLYRDEEHVDGAWMSSRHGVLLCAPSATKVLIDHDADAAMPDSRPFYEVGSPAVQAARFERGVQYAMELDAVGGLPRAASIYAPRGAQADEPAARDHKGHRLGGREAGVAGEWAEAHRPARGMRLAD